MNILDYYNEKCNDKEWYDDYYQCGKSGSGSIFKCLNTNYRDLSTFEYYFQNFKKYINVPRSQWDKKETTGQEIAKQYVVPMLETFLYFSSKDSNGELIYNITSRGQEFDKMLNENFSSNEKKLLVFLFIVNASFNRIPRYIIKTSQKVWDNWQSNGLNVQKLKVEIENFISKHIEIKNINTIFEYDIIWYISFYNDSNFLKLYQVADKETKTRLINETIDSYSSKNKKNVLAWKYKSTNFQKPTLIDTMIMLYLSKVIIDFIGSTTDSNTFYSRILDYYSSMLPINNTKVLQFINCNENVFGVICANAISIEDDFTERYVPTYRSVTKQIIEIPADKIDTTSKEGIEKLETVRQVLKTLAKEKSGYRCALESLNNCKYFTSKEDNENFLEIHHLVPREFAYDFDDTIEFVENYVPLCPNCHRMIHKAVDRERKGLITYLFNQRIEELKKHDIDVNIKTLFKYYKFDKD